MKRLSLVLALLAALPLPSRAQNNPYSIDDECYTWFMASEQAMEDFEGGTFESAQQNLLETALRKKDTKAQTIYYVEQLKHSSHLAQWLRRQNLGAWDSQLWNARINEEMETAQRIARATGYMQYYYYAAEVCQTYFFNTRQDVVASAMLNSMMDEARETGDEYAMWKVLIYLGKLYQRNSDKYSTQKYLKEVVRLYENSQDPTIRRQSMTVTYCELADTYPVASDSARLFYHRAEQVSITRPDTIRVTYYKAQLSAWDNRLEDYRNYRDFCLSAPIFPNVIRDGKECFNCIDNILSGTPVQNYITSLDKFSIRHQLTFLSALSYRRHQWETSAIIREKFIEYLLADIYYVNNQRLDQMTAQYENNRLSADLAASRKTTRIAILVSVLVIALLAAALVVGSRRWRKNKD